MGNNKWRTDRPIEDEACLVTIEFFSPYTNKKERGVAIRRFATWSKGHYRNRLMEGEDISHEGCWVAPVFAHEKVIAWKKLPRTYREDIDASK